MTLRVGLWAATAKHTLDPWKYSRSKRSHKYHGYGRSRILSCILADSVSVLQLQQIKKIKNSTHNPSNILHQSLLQITPIIPGFFPLHVLLEDGPSLAAR